MIALTKKEWLKRARTINEELKQLKTARQEAWDIATAATSGTTGERVKRSRENSSEKNNHILLEYDLKISMQKEKLLQCKSEILEAIAMLEDSRYRILLIAYYVNCKSWEEVAVQMNYGIRQVYRLHGDALQKVKIA